MEVTSAISGDASISAGPPTGYKRTARLQGSQGEERAMVGEELLGRGGKGGGISHPGGDGNSR